MTLFLQTAAAYDSGKHQIVAARRAAGANGTTIKAAAVGDDGYSFVVGDQVGLLVKKGAVSLGDGLRDASGRQEGSDGAGPREAAVAKL